MNPVVVIPVFDEAPTVGGLVTQARRHAPVIVVDDGSRDGGGALAASAGAEVVRHDRRLGKAAALRTGIAAARTHGASHVVTLDGDGQHDPGDLPRILTAAREDPAALVIGARSPAGAAGPPARVNARQVAGFFVEWLGGLGVRDTQSGFRVYPVALLDSVQVRGGGFVFETEVLVAAARHGWRAREVPVTGSPVAARPSRFRPVQDGVAVGAYLAVRIAERWAREARHAAWPAASGATGGRSAGVAAGTDERRRQVALATVSTPLLLAAAVAQMALGRRGPDVVTPLVRRLYSVDRLAAARTGAGGGRRLAVMETGASPG